MSSQYYALREDGRSMRAGIDVLTCPLAIMTAANASLNSHTLTWSADMPARSSAIGTTFAFKEWDLLIRGAVYWS